MEIEKKNVNKKEAIDALIQRLCLDNPPYSST